MLLSGQTEWVQHHISTGKRPSLSSPLQAGNSVVAMGSPPLLLAKGSILASVQLSNSHREGARVQQSGDSILRANQPSLWKGRDSVESKHCHLFFSLHNNDPPLAWDALAHLHTLCYIFPPFALILGSSGTPGPFGKMTSSFSVITLRFWVDPCQSPACPI